MDHESRLNPRAGLTQPQHPRIAGPTSWRHLWNLARNPTEVYRYLYQCEPAILRLSAGRFDFVLVAEPSANVEVLKDPQIYAHDTWDYRALRPLIGEGLLTVDDAGWRNRREAVAPLFMSQSPRRLVDACQLASQRLQERLRRASEQQSLIDLYRVFLDFMLSAVSQMLIGRDLADPSDRLGQSLSRALEQVGSWRLLRFLLPIGRSQTYRALRELRDLIQSEIRLRRTMPRDDLLQRLVDGWPESATTDHELCDEVVTLLFTSQISPAAIATWGAWLLEGHPTVRSEVASELQGLSRCPPALDDLPKLRQTVATLSETLRLYPAVWGIPRVVTRDTLLQGGAIRRGDQVMVLPYATHRDPRWWTDANAFRPERFLDSPALAEGTYLPYGIGPRSCIGAAATKVLVLAAWSVLLREYQFLSDPDRRVEPRFTVTLHPGSGYWGRLLPIRG